MSATAAQRFVACGPAELREKDDFYPTPPEGTDALLAVEAFTGAIWEPACGAGDMSRVLEAAGHADLLEAAWAVVEQVGERYGSVIDLRAVLEEFDR